jgi:hypothetical protein
MAIFQTDYYIYWLRNNEASLKCLIRNGYTGLMKSWVYNKQWPLAPNLQEWRITRANVARQVTFFSKMAFGKCRRVWQVLGKWFGECWRVWRVRATQLGEC